MKRNYLKPLCSVVPIHGLQLMEGSYRIDRSNTVKSSSDIGWARETEPTDVPSQNSLWDD